MTGDSCEGFAAALGQRIARAADVETVARLARSTWHDIDNSLSPIFGQRGTAALFQRSAHLTAGRHPWMAALSAGVQPAVDHAAFERLLEQQTTADASAAAAAQVHALCVLLTTLIGASLTDRLLRFARTRLEAESPPQDTSHEQ